MKKILFSLLALFLAFSLRAQQPAKGVSADRQHPTLTLDDCIRMALDCDNDYAQRRLDSVGNEINLSSAKAAFLPELSAGVGQSFSFGRSPDKTGVIIDQSTGNTSLSASANYTIFSGLRRLSALSVAKKGIELSKATLEALRDQVALNVIQMYYQVLMQEEMMAVTLAGIEQTKYTLGYTKQLVEGGRWALAKQLEIEAQLANEEVSLIDARNDLYLTRLNLALNIDYGSPDSLYIVDPDIDRLVEQARGKLIPAETVYNMALETRADIKVSHLNVDIAKKGVASAQSGYLPSFSFNAGYTNGYFFPFDKGQNLANPSFEDQIRHNGRYSIGFSLSIPIFDALKTPLAIRQAKMRVGLAKVDETRAQQALYRNITTAHANAVSASKKIEVARTSAETTKQSLEMTKAAFEAGRSTPLELEQARNRYIVAEMQAIRAKYDFVLKAAILERYVGESELR